MKKVAIISTGNELIYGNVQDSNAQFISSKLFITDFSVVSFITTGDSPEGIIGGLDYSLKIADVIIITGGLGPTEDDNTVGAVCAITGSGVEFDGDSLVRMNAFFKAVGREVGELDRNMAAVPSGSTVIGNNHGLAPGFLLDFKGKIIVAMPGVPREMKPMFVDSVIPKLADRFGMNIRANHSIHAISMKETDVTALVAKMEIPHQEIMWGITAQGGQSTVTFVQKGSIRIDTGKIADESARLFGINILLPQNSTPEEELLQLLLENEYTISFAESCTGGLASKRLTDISGVSKVFPGSVVSYSNDVKHKLLGVNADKIELYGAVSEHVAGEMAIGVRNLFKSDIGVSITGIAGPDGGTPEKPVGTVCFGFDIAGQKITFTRRLLGNRDMIRNFASLFSIDFVRRFLRKKIEIKN